MDSTPEPLEDADAERTAALARYLRAQAAKVAADALTKAATDMKTINDALVKARAAKSAAEQLGISERTLYRKLKSYGLHL